MVLFMHWKVTIVQSGVNNVRSASKKFATVVGFQMKKESGMRMMGRMTSIMVIHLVVSQI